MTMAGHGLYDNIQCKIVVLPLQPRGANRVADTNVISR